MVGGDFLRSLAKRAVNHDRLDDRIRAAAIGVRDRYRVATRAKRRLPSFIILGCHKGGTTALYDYLALHPQVVPSLEKEVHYFDVAYDGDADSYRVQFPFEARMRQLEHRSGRPAVTGEASPYYLSFPHCPPRVKQMVPAAKLIALLRDPVTRSVSAFHHNRRRTPWEPLTEFAAAVDRELTLFADELERVKAHELHNDRNYARYCYLRRSVYVDQLGWWHEQFPPDQLLVIQSEELARRPAETFRAVTDFLGLDPWVPTSFPPSNTNVYPDIDDDVLGRLVEWFRPHNERLFDYLGVEYDWLS